MATPWSEGATGASTVADHPSPSAKLPPLSGCASRKLARQLLITPAVAQFLLRRAGMADDVGWITRRVSPQRIILVVSYLLWSVAHGRTPCSAVRSIAVRLLTNGACLPDDHVDWVVRSLDRQGEVPDQSPDQAQRTLRRYRDWLDEQDRERFGLRRGHSRTPMPRPTVRETARQGELFVHGGERQA